MSRAARHPSPEHPVGFSLAGRILLAAAAAAAVALVLWLGWTGRQMREDARSGAQRALRVAELRGTVAYLDEWMQMSARMAAASGERRWADRYEEAVPKLDAAIAEAAQLAGADVRAAFASTTGEAHRDLVTMERRALSLAAAGDLPAARALLDGPEFGYIGDVYQTGIDVFGADLATSTDARSTDLERRAWLGTAGSAIAVLSLVAASLWLRSRSRLRAALARAAVAAHTDALTGLPNRHAFMATLDAVLGQAPEQACALVLFDLDRFKALNHAHGPSVGDEVLLLVADRLRAEAGAGDVVARVGVDEFAVLRPGGAEAAAAGRDMGALAARLAAVVASPLALGNGMGLQVSASLGGAAPDEACRSADALMHRAGVAVRRAKADGRGCFRRFEPGMEAEFLAKAQLEGELRQAVAAHALVPHYQPLVDLQTGRLRGVEMLARWPHAERGMVPPVEFIPLAEETGLIGAITEQLLRRACRDAAAWPGGISVACNISPLQLRNAGLPGLIAAILAETGLPAHRLELEITESALVGDLDLARKLLDQLIGLGVSLALDDFGTGYSSLRQLQALPFSKVKIDRSFVAGLGGDAESDKIIAAVVGLGHSLGLAVVAEGVETEAVAAALRLLGCDIGQGWLFGRPGPADRIAALIGSGAPACVGTAA